MRKKVFSLFLGITAGALVVGIAIFTANGKKRDINSTTQVSERADDSLVAWDYGDNVVTIGESDRMDVSNLWKHTEEMPVYVYCFDTKETTQISKEQAKDFVTLPKGTYKVYCQQEDGHREDVSSYISVETYFDGTEQGGIISLR